VSAGLAALVVLAAQRLLHVPAENIAEPVLAGEVTG
jgi:hypothetical protein